MRKIMVSAIALFIALGAADVSFSGQSCCKGKGEANAAEVRKKCPVMGGDVNKDLYTDYKGKRIYFCCPSCREEFKKNPEKYVNKV